MTEAIVIRRRNGLICDKILRRHQDRLAIVYVRQSTVQQVERHQESTRLQYALADRASQYGWEREQIVVIDDDLGRSGASVEGRLGFQRLVAEVGSSLFGMGSGAFLRRARQVNKRSERFSSSRPIDLGCSSSSTARSL